MIFEDDPYVALRFEGESLPTMLSMDAERVVYASSFSKTVCPGIRVGYLVGPEALIAEITKLATNTYISPNMVAQGIVYEFARSGAIDKSIETVRNALRERAQTLGQALARASARGDVRRSAGRLLHVGRPAPGQQTWRRCRRRRPSWACSSSRGPTSARGRRVLPAAGLLRRHPGADRGRA